MTGFSIKEVMSGTHRPLDETKDQSLEFEVVWGHHNLANYLNPKHPEFLKAELLGWVTVGGICEKTVCQGKFKLDYFGEHKITYDFIFKNGEWGKTFRLHGEKINIKPWNILTSHTTCFCTITDYYSGQLISKGITYFRWRTILSFLTSFRFR